jgi:hypothetical protein
VSARKILTFPRADGYMTIMCPWCKWPFHCPVEQSDYRIMCRACESIYGG